MEKKPIPRREFIKTTATVAAVASLPLASVSCSTPLPIWPEGKFNIAVCGLGMGFSNLKNCMGENIVAICDVDQNRLNRVLEIFATEFPDKIAPLPFQDYKEMLKTMDEVIDGVIIATPDHNHAYITLECMKAGKHVYTQKPLTRTVYESRILAQAATKYPNIVTQMGNQGASFDDTRWICEAIWNGDIGEIKEVQTWTNRPVWPQNLNAPEAEDVPSNLDWKLWLGPIQNQAYNSAYHPWNWRGWWAFGTGAFGDMACHILDPVFRSLKLKYPIKVHASSSKWNVASPPESEIVRFIFPEREALDKVTLPEVSVTWYDGGLTPPRPVELNDREMMGDDGGGVIFIGTKGKIMCGCYGKNPRILGSEFAADYQPPKTLRRVTTNHEGDWIRACKEDPEKRVKPYSKFEYAGPFNEMVAMGTVAPRLGMLNRTLEWDGERMEFTNIESNERMKIPTKYYVENNGGFPQIKSDSEIVNVSEYAQEMIKPTFKKGWELKL